jgi:hypothetical protein
MGLPCGLNGITRAHQGMEAPCLDSLHWFTCRSPVCISTWLTAPTIFLTPEITWQVKIVSKLNLDFCTCTLCHRQWHPLMKIKKTSKLIFEIIQWKLFLFQIYLRCTSFSLPSQGLSLWLYWQCTLKPQCFSWHGYIIGNQETKRNGLSLCTL